MTGAEQQKCQCDECKLGVPHTSDCAVHNPAADAITRCDCNGPAMLAMTDLLIWSGALCDQEAAFARLRANGFVLAKASGPLALPNRLLDEESAG